MKRAVVVDNPDEFTAQADRRSGLCPLCHHEKGEVKLSRKGKAWNHRCLAKTPEGPCNCDYPVFGRGARESRR